MCCQVEKIVKAKFKKTHFCCSLKSFREVGEEVRQLFMGKVE